MKIVTNVVLAQCIYCVILDIFTINVGGIGAYFVYFQGYLKKMFTRETTNY